MNADDGVMDDERLGRMDLAGAMEAILELHQPCDTWNGMLTPTNKNCKQCHDVWPCKTVVVIAEASGSPVPEPVMTEKEYWAVRPPRSASELYKDMEREVHTRMTIGPVY